MNVAASPRSLDPLLRSWKDTSPQATKYRRLAQALSDCIRSGAYLPGEHLPSETEISAAMPVGLSTVQKALAQLVDEGLIVRRRKVGTVVVDPRHRVPEVHVYRFRDPATGEIMMPFTRVLALKTVPTAEYGSLLTEFKEEHVVRIDRLVWVTGSQPAYGSFFLRRAFAVGMPDTPDGLHGTSYHRLLWNMYGIRTERVRHEARADLLSGPACKHLDLAVPHVGMIWDAHEYDSQGVLQIVQRFELPRGHRSMELVEGVSSPGI